MDQVRVGIIGSAFSSSIHAEAFEEVPEAVLVAVCLVIGKRLHS